jgi:Zn-dependent alcohol dehydrogenase
MGVGEDRWMVGERPFHTVGFGEEDPKITVSFPDHNELKRGTFISILRQINLTVEEFCHREWGRVDVSLAGPEMAEVDVEAITGGLMASPYSTGKGTRGDRVVPAGVRHDVASKVGAGALQFSVFDVTRGSIRLPSTHRECRPGAGLCEVVTGSAQWVCRARYAARSQMTLPSSRPRPNGRGRSSRHAYA